MQVVPDRPKRPLNPFFRYKKEQYEKYKSSNKDAKLTELVKLMSDGFKALDAKEKERYELPYQKEYEQWAKLNDEYKKKVSLCACCPYACVDNVAMNSLC